MKKVLFSLFLFIITSSGLIGQNNEEYQQIIDEAKTLYDSKDYLKSAKKYVEAFETNGDKGGINDRYNAACAWSCASQPDSAFVQLHKIATKGNFTKLDWILNDSDLESLHQDKRWNEVISIITKNKEKAEKHLDKPLVALLDTIYQDDQNPRNEIEEIEKKYGRGESDEMQAQWSKIAKKDSINLIKVREILDERGWLGPDIIGEKGNLTLFLVIQHADLKTQEKYLPLLKKAVKLEDAQPQDLALLEDRLAIRKGGKQIYGSQLSIDEETGEYYVSPLIDPDNVNERRVKVGLNSIEDYISNWGLTWDVEEYKKKLPKYLDKGK